MFNRDVMRTISMNGRMAYIILCIEKYLLEMYPEKDWKELSKRMWKATSEAWDEWMDSFIEIIPQYLFEFDTYEDSDFEELSEEEYKFFIDLYSGVTEGLFDDSTNKVGYIINTLKLMEEVYCYTSIPGTGEESIDLILQVCEILEEDNVSLPDLDLVEFTSFDERNGWGEKFDGEKMSMIL